MKVFIIKFQNGKYLNPEDENQFVKLNGAYHFMDKESAEDQLSIYNSYNDTRLKEMKGEVELIEI